MNGLIEMSHTVFSMGEVAEYLHIDKNDVEELVRAREIPYQQVGDRYIFRKGEVDAWASQRILGLQKQQLTDYHKATTHGTRKAELDDRVIRQLMTPAMIQPELVSRTKASVVRDMVCFAETTDLVFYPTELLASLQERERMGSTAMAGGMAILHPRHHDPYAFERSFLALGRAVRPLPFGSPDGDTTDLFFLLCCQDDKLHLHALTRVCMLCYHTSLLFDLRQAESADEMMELLLKAEEEVLART
jgi:PTS system nitrogen regulatory IIA component